MPEVGARKWIITITVILGALLELVDTTVVNVSLPQIMGNLGATLQDVGWVVTAYSIANVVILPMSGWLSAKFGRRNYFAFSIILFTTSSFFCGNAHGIWELVAFRFIQGIGGGGLLSTAQAILMEAWPREQLGTATAIFGIGVVVGPTLGPTLGGYITDHWSWPWVFYINIPLGIIATLLTLQYIKESVHRLKIYTVDYFGILLLAVSVGSLQYILERGEEDDWYNSPLIIVLTMITVIASIGFLWREMTTEHPVVNLRILKDRSLSIGMVTTFILGFGLFGSVFIFPIFCQNLLGFSAEQTGILLIPGGLATIAMMPFVGRMLQRGVPPQIMGAIGFVFFYLFTHELAKSNLLSGESNFYVPLILRGIGLSLIFVPLTTLALGSLKPVDVPQGTGLNNMMRQLGGSFGIALITTLLHNREGLHRAQLVGHINQYNPAFTQQLSNTINSFIAKGYSMVDAQMMAYKAIDFSVLNQTMLLSYIDGFWFVGVFFVFCIPLLFLQKFKRGSAINAGGH